MSALAGVSVALVGAGKMGSALLAGLARGARPARALVVEPKPSPRLIALCEEHGFALVSTVEHGSESVDALVLAIKPQALDGAAPALAPLVGPKTLLVSILAGKRVADLSARLPASAIVRAMPNTPGAIGRGVTGAFASAGVDPDQRRLAQDLLETLGVVAWIEREELMDALTAVSGSGPAYVFYLAECLAAAGERAGLPGELAVRLARETIAGAGELMRREPDVPAQTLRENVTSPGGVTAAALGVLMAEEEGLERLMARAIAAGTRRAGELAG
ncbi:MAG TPA: pyrroline-5-carboxylate reductase [Methylocystis sp.]|nr:pyrroline-5-carboxylate reductase [Methylocystis sp.]